MLEIEKSRHEETLNNWRTAGKIYLTGKRLGQIFSSKEFANEVCKVLCSYFTSPTHDVVEAYKLDGEFLGYMIIDRAHTGHMSVPALDIIQKAEKNYYNR